MVAIEAPAAMEGPAVVVIATVQDLAEVTALRGRATTVLLILRVRGQAPAVGPAALGTMVLEPQAVQGRPLSCATGPPMPPMPQVALPSQMQQHKARMEVPIRAMAVEAAQRTEPAMAAPAS